MGLSGILTVQTICVPSCFTETILAACDWCVDCILKSSRAQWWSYDYSTNWRRMQMRGLTVWLPLMLFWVVTACVEMNPLRVPKVWTFRLLDSSWIFRSSEMWFKFLSFIEINFDFHWVGSMPDYFRSNGSQCNFRPRSTTSVHGRQLPSTSGSPQYLIHCYQHE